MKRTAVPHPVCSQCNYDLSGITPDENGHLTCPECGVRLRPMDPELVFTKEKLHAFYFTRLLLPSAIPALLVLLLSIFTPVGAFIGCFLLPIGGIIAFFAWLEVASTATFRARPHPRPLPLWSIPLLGLLYLLPFFVLTIGSLMLANSIW
ncbi:MAG: hypothetical protein KC996_07265 [Phycisphaerales bacterium]|nr:hypothetical protein [Phycisphaerales bacterium]